MALIKLVSALALLATHTCAQSTPGNKAAHAAAQAPARPPLGLELPREEQGRPFYEGDYGYHKSQPSEESGAPIYNEKLPTDQDYWTILAQAQDNPTQDTDTYYADLPSLPAQDLTPPLSVLQWNPENDPTLYFQLPVELTREAVPTNVHPKKYHKVLVEKTKPVNSRPKEEISLIPVSEDELIRAEKQLQKTAYNQAKVEHQRKLQYEREQQVNQQEDEEEKA